MEGRRIYFYGACVASVSDESNTDNNCSLGVRVIVEEDDGADGQEGPDLIVQSPSVSAVTLTPGQEFTLNVTVHNQGDEQAPATMLHYYRSNNATITASDTQVGTAAIGELNASATHADSLALTAPTREGINVYFYGACVDPVADESNTDNNCSSAVDVTVKASGIEETPEEEGEKEQTDTTSSNATSGPDLDLDVDESRTVRLIYFLPNDRPFRAAAIPRIKDEIRKAQTFFAEQMQAHGYGNRTFRIETDAQGEPLVHRVVGQHPESHYFATVGGEKVWQAYHFPELEQTFDFYENVYVVYSDISRFGGGVTGGRSSKKGGWVDFNRTNFNYSQWQTLAHELGHAFGLNHDFRDGAYIMSYGGPSQLSGDRDRISAYAAEFLSVHSYFNDAIPIEDYPPSAGELDKSDTNRLPPRRFPGRESSPPTIKLISPTEISRSSWSLNDIDVIPTSYPAGSKSVSVQLEVGDAEGLHQVSFHDRWSLREYRSFDGERNTVVDFDFDGSPTYAMNFPVPTSLSESSHFLAVEAVDTDGNVSMLFLEAFPHSLAKVSGDAQEGAASAAKPLVPSSFGTPPPPIVDHWE